MYRFYCTKFLIFFNSSPAQGSFMREQTFLAHSNLSVYLQVICLLDGFFPVLSKTYKCEFAEAAKVETLP